MAVRLRTTSTSTGAVGLARLRRGVSETEFRNRLRRVFATEGQENIEAAKALMAAAELYGGGFTHVGTDTGYTVELDARTRICCWSSWTSKANGAATRRPARSTSAACTVR